MNKEQAQTVGSEKTGKQGLKEKVINGRLPVIEDENRYTRFSDPELEEGRIVHYKKTINFLEGDKKFDRFKLLKQIGGFNYIFTLAGSYGSYSVSFKTSKYEYAVVNLSKEESKILYKTLANFIESIVQAHPSINEIRISPADSPYSKEEVEVCVDEIMTSTMNELTREEILSEYKGHEVFDLYFRLFGKEFECSSQGKQRSGGRSRLFRSIVKKYLPDWEIGDDEYGFSVGHDFVIKRRQ